MNRFKKWWNAERVGRFEEGTSQDVAPTNGALVIYAFVCSWPIWILLAHIAMTEPQWKRLEREKIQETRHE